MGALAPASPPRSGGFTLIEVLVILVILGLSAALLLPNLLPDNRQALTKEAQRLAETLQHAALAAQARGENIVWSAEPGGYRFWLDNSAADAARGSPAAGPAWSGLRDDQVLEPRSMPHGTYVQLLQVASQPAHKSWLVFRADGLNEPYAIEVANSAARLWIRSDPLNRVSLADPQP